MFYSIIKLLIFQYHTMLSSLLPMSVSHRRPLHPQSFIAPVTVYRLPIRLPAKSALTWPVVELVAYKPSQKLVVGSIPVGRTFFVKKRKRRKPHLRVKIGLCGERKLNLLNIKMMLRGSLTSDKNK